MSKFQVDGKQLSVAVARQVLLARLRKDRGWSVFASEPRQYEPFVEFTGNSNWGLLVELLRQAFWGLVCDGILIPGSNATNPNFPHFCLTEYGKSVLKDEHAGPYDPEGYLASIEKKVASIDPTVFAYLKESLASFSRGSHVASTLLLGIAAERVFLLLCDAMAAAISSEAEGKEFQKILSRFAIKPKLEWMHTKFQSLQDGRAKGFPDNATLAVTAIYDLLRYQRNDLGHPREEPPKVGREDAHSHLLVFPRFYEVAEQIRLYLSTASV